MRDLLKFKLRQPLPRKPFKATATGEGTRRISTNLDQAEERRWNNNGADSGMLESCGLYWDTTVMNNPKNIWRKGLQGPKMEAPGRTASRSACQAASGTHGVPLVKPHSAPHHSVALVKKGEGGGRREKEDRKKKREERWMWMWMWMWLLTLMYVM
jgi:hypothetical protein